MPGDPGHSLWPCRDQGVIPVGFAGAVQPCLHGPKLTDVLIEFHLLNSATGQYLSNHENSEK